VRVGGDGMSRATPRWAIEHPETDIDHDGSGEYADSEAVVSKFRMGKLPFHHAHRRMQEDFGITSEDALYVLFPPMELNPIAVAEEE